MNKKLRMAITICALCVLLVSMYTPTAYAAARGGSSYSKAFIDSGEYDDPGPENKLYANGLTGSVESHTATTSASSYVKGYMYTRGLINTVLRDTKTVTNKSYANFATWDNDDGHTGYYWAYIVSPYSNHSGTCIVNHSY